MTMLTPAQQLQRYEYVMREQMNVIDQLRIENQALVDWIQGDSDALTLMATANLVVVDFRERVRQARLKAPLVATKTIEHIP